VEHEIMLKFLFFTAVRVSELVKIKVGEVDLGSCKVFIDQGKGAKDRYILFPASFRLVLKSHLQANPKNRYLFETSRCGLLLLGGSSRSYRATGRRRGSLNRYIPIYSAIR
jgi:integrase/recombinase XerD